MSKIITIFAERNLKKFMGRKLTTEEFINKSKQVHGDLYDYSKVVYVKSTEKVTIICKEHGEFLQIPRNHMQGAKCRKCSDKKRSTLADDFFEKANIVHENKYTYDMNTYKGLKEKVLINCSLHGDFEQVAGHHLSGGKCPKCLDKKHLENFIIKANNIHKNKYNYSKTEWVKDNGKVDIICPTHGLFTQRIYNHLRGHGCPLCSNKTKRRHKDTKGELLIKDWLDKNNIIYSREYKIKMDRVARNSKTVKVDFYIKLNNIEYLIEYNGEQHYKFVKYFHKTKKNFEKQLRRDVVLQEYCGDNNNIKLVEFKYSDNIDYINKTLTNLFL